MQKLVKTSINNLKSLFINGLLFLLPIAITFALFSFSFNLVKAWLMPIKRLNLAALEIIPHYEIVLVIGFIFLVGLTLKFLILKPLLNIIEDIFSKLPLIRTVYFGAKQLVNAFSATDQMTFKHVVFVQFPRPGMYSIGFLTSTVPTELSPNKEKTYYNIYIPTTPNPTTGYFVMLPQEEFMHVDLSRNEAIALIISGGILQPDRYKK